MQLLQTHPLNFPPSSEVGNFLTLMSSLVKQLIPSQAQRFTNFLSNDADECKRSLSEVLEKQIIPRLVLAHSPKSADSTVHSSIEISHKKIVTFVLLSYAGDSNQSDQLINGLLSEGVTTEQIFLELIGPAARQLGQMWDQDKVDFTQVTLGLVRMHEITHRLGFAYKDGPQLQGEVKRIMLASAPGSQHFLGMTIVSSFFRKESWDVVIELSASQAELVYAVKNEWFDVIGISCATESQLATLADLIRHLKRTSANPSPGILLGGPIFTIKPYDPKEFGADGICTDVNEAVALAASFKV